MRVSGRVPVFGRVQKRKAGERVVPPAATQNLEETEGSWRRTESLLALLGCGFKLQKERF